MQKGGIVINKDTTPKDAYEFFINNSYCELVSYETRGGIIFKLILKPEFSSPYTCLRSNDPNAEVRTIILKLVFLNENAKKFQISEYYDDEYGDDLINLNNIQESGFKNEIDIQTEIFTRSLDDFLEPICPSIVFTDILKTLHDTMSFAIRLARHVHPEDTTDAGFILLQIRSNSHLSDFKIGVIMMECLTGFDKLSRFPKTEFNEGLAIFELWRLYQSGFIHGDPHLNNFMYDPLYHYVEGTPGRALVIDFGSSYKHDLPPIDHTNMIEVTNASLIIRKLNPTIRSKRPSLQWLDYTNPDKKASMIICLNKIYANRELTKEKFISHIETCDQGTTGSPSDAFYGFSGGTPKKKEGVSIHFNKLDPSHIFTHINIKNYINKEHKYANEIKHFYKKSHNKSITNRKSNRKSITNRKINRKRISNRKSNSKTVLLS